MHLLTRANAPHPVAFIIILSAIVLSPGISQGEEIATNGKKLLNNCQLALEYIDDTSMPDSTEVIEAVIFCDDFITGYRENENIKEIYMPGHYHRGYCLPNSGITNGELARVIVKFIKANDQEEQLPASTVIKDALVDYYPCSN